MAAPRCPALFGCQSEQLTSAERNFFHDSKPAGLILFSRNCKNPQQLRALTDSFRALLAPEPVLIAIDQEGGTVQRLRPPRWQNYPAAAEFGALAKHNSKRAQQALALSVHLMSRELLQAGINVNAFPLVDLRRPETDSSIACRAFSKDPKTVSLLASTAIQTMQRSRILPIIKHLPGQGRATSDSHLTLPRITTPLNTLAQSDWLAITRIVPTVPAAMLSHVLYSALDKNNPAPFSRLLIAEIIRKRLAFSGLLFSDCLHMEALSGTIAERAQKAQQAGIDIVLDSHGDVASKQATARALQPLEGRAEERFNEALKWLQQDASAELSEKEEANHQQLLTLLAAKD